MSRAVDENTSTTVELVIESLMEGIRSGRYVPGQRIFAGEFATAFGVSRSPVREAFHLLAGEGVLDLLPNRGVEIRRLGHKHLVDMMEMLRVTGVFGFDLVVPHMSDTEVRKRFIKAFEEVERVGERRQPYEWFQALVDVHLLINDVADNIYLRSIWKGFHLTHFNRMLAEKLPGPHWERYIANYRALGETILSDKPERAGKLFNSHMQWALKLLNDLHESKPDSSRLRT